jgi:hypothetical protein
LLGIQHFWLFAAGNVCGMMKSSGVFITKKYIFGQNAFTLHTIDIFILLPFVKQQMSTKEIKNIA